MQTTQRSLLASEFEGAFDALPPAVARHLLSVPDAMTYQFVCVLEPAESVNRAAADGASSERSERQRSPLAQAQFSTQVYLAIGGQYDEARKLVLRRSHW